MSEGHILEVTIPQFLNSRELTYPTLGKGTSSSKVPWDGICQFQGGYPFRILAPFIWANYQCRIATVGNSSKNGAIWESWYLHVNTHVLGKLLWFLETRIKGHFRRIPLQSSHHLWEFPTGSWWRFFFAHITWIEKPEKPHSIPTLHL